MEKMSLTSAPSINWSTWVKPLDTLPHDPNPYRRSWCEGDSNAYDAFWKARHPWDLVDYHLYLIAIERKSRNWELRMSGSWLIESDGSRWENFGYAIDSDDRDCQTGWRDPVVIFASLPIPHATGCPDRRIVLGVNLRTHCLVGYLFESAPESIAELVSVWNHRELIIDLEFKRFIQIVKHSIDENRNILTNGIFNYFRESNRHLHGGMDAVVTIKYIQFLRDAISGANLSAPSSVGAEPSNLFDMEEHLRDLLCRGSARAWISSHRGVTTEDIRKSILAKTSNSDIFSDQLFPPDIVNDEKKAGRNSWTPMEPDTSVLMRCEVDLPRIGLTSLKNIRQSTSDMVILLGIFGIECSSLAKDEEDCEVAPWVERMIQRRGDQQRGLLNEKW
ncbi:uncharacterized protein N7496_006288 [Penicillium cataractarum]|uniref:Uncharacterized protein n=1 Tax=Penicillium cataractarum TaxID=2100454 RepID=A0A9W9V8G4_9EURO|nr:uncharacterized protein N7496_006288 [Penicillium cataractarum]KAJ5370196.1 hypothetical protein N7496_006288 [Penicillium cataractarum]